MSASVLISGVSKSFPSRTGEVLAIQDIYLAVDAGEFVCLTGPSGCGKTTLLNLIAGLEKPDAGKILVGGQEVRGPSPQRTVVFQDGALFPWMTCLKNVDYGLRMQANMSPKQRREAAMAALARVGLEGLHNRYPHEISGGQRQRVAIARALVLEPAVLLCDEPFTALDALTRRRLAEDVSALWQATRMTVIWVEHNLYLPALLADRVYVMAAHPGRILDEVLVRLPRPRSPSDPAVLRVGDWLTAWLEALSSVAHGERASLPPPPEGAEVRPAVH